MPAGIEDIVDTTAQEARDAAAAVKEQARLASLAQAESLAKDKAAALLLAQEEVRSREEELEDADAELTRLERNFHSARLRAAEVRKELALAKQQARQQEGQNGSQGQGGHNRDLGQGSGDPNAQGGLNGGLMPNQLGAGGSGQGKTLLPPPGFGQGGPQYGLGSLLNQTNNQNQQPGSMGNRGTFLRTCLRVW
jgi:hypothetical protein